MLEARIREIEGVTFKQAMEKSESEAVLAGVKAAAGYAEATKAKPGQYGSPHLHVFMA